MIPRNAQSILDARMGGLRPSEQIAVSFVGNLPWGYPTVYADSGRDYDWRFLLDLPVMVVVRPGVDVRASLAAIFDVAALYPTLVDVEAEQLASVIDNKPLRLWPMTRHSENWKTLFA